MRQIKISRPLHKPDVIILTDSLILEEQIRLLYLGFTNTTESVLLINHNACMSWQMNNNPLYVLVEQISPNTARMHYRDNVWVTDDPLQEITKILFKNSNIQEGYFAMHAGAVEYGGKAYILTAVTTAGKTTLITYLINKGFQYITDDCVLINQNDLSVYPYCNPVHLRDGGLEVLTDNQIDLPNMYYLNGKTIQRYIFMPSNCISEPLPIGGVLFIRRTDTINISESICGSECVKRLLKSPTTNYGISADYLRFLARLSSINTFQIRYKDMSYVADRIIEAYSCG